MILAGIGDEAANNLDGQNCMNYRRLSRRHALELLDKCPGLKGRFDTANPVG
jgi:hypothetical protein